MLKSKQIRLTHKHWHNYGSVVEVDGQIINGKLDRNGEFIIFDNVAPAFTLSKEFFNIEVEIIQMCIIQV
jgi:hypothetical protein